MKCINDELIQKYIDGETNTQETARIEQHLAECPHCARKVEEHRTFVNAIKRDLDSLISDYPISDFRYPISDYPIIRFPISDNRISDIAYRISHNRISKISYRKYLIPALAACLISFVVFFIHKHDEKPPQPTAVQMIYSFDGEFDSNKPVSQQEMTIVMIDAHGKIIDCNEL